MERAQTEIARRLQLASGVGLSDRTANERILPGISIGSPVEVKLLLDVVAIRSPPTSRRS